MRVAVLGGYGPSLIDFRGHLIEAIAHRGHEVVCGAADLDANVERALLARGVRRCRDLPISRAGTNPARDARTLFALWAWLAEEKPDILFAYTVKPVVFGGLAARLAKVRRFYPLITGLGYAFIDASGRRRRALARTVRGLYWASLRGATTTLFQNVDDEAEFRRRGLLGPAQRSVVTSGSGVDLAAYAPAPRPAPPGGPRFLFIGRLLWEKGVGELIRAATRLRSTRPEIRVQLLGGLDPNPATLSRRELAALEAGGIVEYLGETEDVRPYIAACTALVLPSYREGTPRVVLEAMAMARPIITTDVPGCRETVKHGETGLLVPARDGERLADAIVALADDPARCAEMGRRSRALAEAKYDVHAVNRAILDVLGLEPTPRPAGAAGTAKAAATGVA